MINFYEYSKTELYKQDVYSELIPLIPRMDVLSLDFSPLIGLIKRNIGLAFTYIKYHKKSRWEELESDIITYPYMAAQYADIILGGRWLEAESSILQDQYGSYYYARQVIKGRWTEAEANIAKSPVVAYFYARDVIKGRWIEAEPYIMENKSWWPIYTSEMLEYDKFL